MPKKSRGPRKPSPISQMDQARHAKDITPTEAPPSIRRRGLLGLFWLAALYLEHHLKTLIVLMIAVVAIVFFALILIRPNCIELRETPLGPLSICRQSEDQPAGSIADGLHGGIYTDRRAGFTLQLQNPNRWSVIQPVDIPDGSKALVFPEGIVGGRFKGGVILIPEVSVVFARKGPTRGTVATAWVFRIPGIEKTVDKFIGEETEKMLRTGVVSLVFTLSDPMLGASPLSDSKRRGNNMEPARNNNRVRLTTMQIAPSRKDAILIWEAPYERTPADLIGRVVVGTRDTYYVSTLKFRASGDEERSINEELRTILNSFRVF